MTAIQRGRSMSAMRRRQEKMRRSMAAGAAREGAREVTLPDAITIQELSPTAWPSARST
jgi:translation initiation factor IF-2